MKIIVVILFIFINNMIFCQVDTVIWVQKSSLPSSTIQGDGSGYFLIDSDFFVVGGWNMNPGYTIGNVWKYDISLDSWAELQNLPFGPATIGGCFVLNGKGYFLTGADSANNNNCDTMFWEYDPFGDSWAMKKGFPDYSRQNSSFFSYAGIGYVGQTFGCGENDSRFWGFNPVSNQWSAMATLPSGTVGGSVATTSGNYAYLLCGYDQNGIDHNDMWRYDILNNHWDSMGQMPGAVRAFPIIWGFDSVLICGGGSNGLSLFNDFYQYNISQNIWTPIVFQNSFDSTGGGSTFVFNKRGYYFGGWSSVNPSETFTNNIWSFDASKFFPDSTVGIAEVKPEVSFSVYPNPASHESGFSISTSESGSVSFYDALGRTLDERRLSHGLNQVKLAADDEVIFYRATLQSGARENGKVVFVN